MICKCGNRFNESILALDGRIVERCTRDGLLYSQGVFVPRVTYGVIQYDRKGNVLPDLKPVTLRSGKETANKVTWTSKSDKFDEKIGFSGLTV